LIGRTKGGMNTKPHAVTDTEGRPLRFFMTAGPSFGDTGIACRTTGSDYTGAAALLGSLPKVDWLLANRGYDADWFREALKDKRIRP
jgi:transposase